MFVEPDFLAHVPPAFPVGSSIRMDTDGGGKPEQFADWDALAEPLQTMLAGAALRRAAVTIAFQAETLAREMEAGRLEDCGGPDALRLLSTIVRVNCEAEIEGVMAA